MYAVTFAENFYNEKDAKVLYDKLVSLLREKYPNAIFNPSVETDRDFISCCSFEIKEGTISLSIYYKDSEYVFKMMYNDRINSNKNMRKSIKMLLMICRGKKSI